MKSRILKILIILVLLIPLCFLVIKTAGFAVQSFSKSGITVDEGIIVIYDEFDGSTTDFLRMSDSELGSVFPLILENTSYGKIKYLVPINLTIKIENKTIDLNKNAEINYNFIFLDTAYLPHMSKPAELSIYGLGFANPRVLKNGQLCLPPNCIILSYNGTLLFNVSSFSTYSAEETPFFRAVEVTRAAIKFSIDKELINVSLIKGETKREKLIIRNTGVVPILMTLTGEGLGQLVKFDKEVFSLNPGEAREVNIEFFADDKTKGGIYTGRIVASTVSFSKSINVIIEVLEKPLALKLFKLESKLVNDKITKYDKLKAQIYIKNLEEIPKDVSLRYYIYDFSGNEIKVSEENFAINKEARFERGFAIPAGLDSGKYVFYVELLHNGEVSATSINTFELIEVVVKCKVCCYALAAALLVLILIIILLKRRKKEKKRKKN